VVGTSTGPATITATVRWGDGTMDVVSASGSNGAYSVYDSHNYLYDGTYPVYVTAYLGDLPDTGVGEATVGQATVQVGGNTISYYGGEWFTATVARINIAGFQYPDAFGLRASINWGDGANTTATVTSGGDVIGYHKYLPQQTYTTTATVTDGY